MWDWVHKLRGPRVLPPEHDPRCDSAPLIVGNVEITVDTYCPCGDPRCHRLTLRHASVCRRCGRSLAIRSVEFFRASFDQQPTPAISVGYVHLPETLAARPTEGVH